MLTWICFVLCSWHDDYGRGSWKVESSGKEHLRIGIRILCIYGLVLVL